MSLDFYKKIIRIRRDNPVLATGDIKFIVAENNKLMYSRFDNNDEIIVLFNLESEPESFELQKGYSYLNLFSNSSFKSSIILEPFSGMILKQLNK